MVRQISLPRSASKHTEHGIIITKLGKKLNFRHRMMSTAIDFFRRLYMKNAYCENDPFIVIAACCYVAGKAEESPVHTKNVVAVFFSRATRFPCV